MVPLPAARGQPQPASASAIGIAVFVRCHRTAGRRGLGVSKNGERAEKLESLQDTAISDSVVRVRC
eukprot:4851291-Prymnesium_polylepis.1